MDYSRRQFLKQSSEIFAIAMFLKIGFISKAWGKPIDVILARWLKEMFDLSRSVKDAKIKPEDWQNAVESLLVQLPLFEIIKFTDLDRVMKTVKFPTEKLGAIHDFPWPEVNGIPPKPPFGHKLFIYQNGSCTPPHAHNHLVSAHLVLKGNIRARTYNRIKDLDKAILIKPERDHVFFPGQVITMSDARENIHWFEGVGPASVSFDVPVSDIEPKKNYSIEAGEYNQIFLDPTVKPKFSGEIEAPVMSFKDSVKKFA